MSKPFLNATVEVIEPDGDKWTVEVDSDGDVRITAPREGEVCPRPGRKGKFFRDMLKAYKTAAKAAGVWDTKAEEYVEKDDKGDIVV